MSQLERLARPFPPKYVRAPAKGKYGDYVPHHIVTQAALAILGPFDLHVGEVFTGENGHIEGCLVTISVRIDGVPVAITEVGDCEQPTNWKTQGARMKDAVSDGVKRCFARLGLGLHLYSGADYFLYDQLKNSQEVGTAPDSATRPVESPPREPAHPNAEAVQSTGKSGPGASVSTAAASAASPASGDPPSTAGPSQPGAGTFKHKRQKLRSRASALVADNVSVADARTAVGLPTIEQSNAEELERWSGLLDDLEFALTKPFTEPANA